MNAKIINIKSDIVISMTWDEAKRLICLAHAGSEDVGTSDKAAIDDFERVIMAANDVRDTDMSLPSEPEFMVTAESGDLNFAGALGWNNGKVQNISQIKEHAIMAAQDAISHWAVCGMKDDLEIDITEGPDEFLIDEYGCPRDGYSWSQVIESPFKIQAPKNTLT